MACHSDHAGPKLTQISRKPFSHALLKPEVQQNCVSCHTKPTNEMHRPLMAQASYPGHRLRRHSPVS